MFNKVNENIIKILGFEEDPLDKQKEAMEKLGTIVYQQVMIEVLEAMKDEDKDKFEKLMNSYPDPEVMFAFLADKVPNINEIVADVAEEVRAENIDIIEEIKSK